ncbi:quinoprotein relay system zinc metallohydrolase 1 [Insolitispirillum peregrinum]|uniref:quinoprotein relay system zinc metallohydrolase 1 n=1 Tax=Insolitispirillum peregrinum TaxID=80876 RepID=UPI003610A5B9
MNWRAAWAGLALLAMTVGRAHAEPPDPVRRDYHLTARQIADSSYVVEGSTEDFSRANGGLMVNSAFIVTDEGVIVLDTGPSRLFGEQFHALIDRTSGGKPIVQVINSHLHPDHFLGNQAFAPETLTATSETIAGISAAGEDFTTNMYRLLGNWMLDTEPVVPKTVLQAHTAVVGGHRLHYLTLAGHSDSDVALFDETTGVLYAADLVFHDRTPTTPHADIAPWLAALEALEALKFKVVVPGHGPVAQDAGPLHQTADWLRWLDGTLRQAARQGLSEAEVFRLPIPERFAALSLTRAEFERSVVHLYPALLRGQLQPSATKVE